MHKVGNIRSGSPYQRQRKIASDLILEIPSYGSKGFRLCDYDEVYGGARGMEEDGVDQALEVVGELCLISNLQELFSNLLSQIFVKNKPLGHPRDPKSQLLGALL